MSSNQHYNPPPGPPPGHNNGHNQGNIYGDQQNQSQHQYQNAAYNQQPYQQYGQQQAPGYPPRPDQGQQQGQNTALNPTGSDRAEQMETLQSYEGTGHHNEHDRNREQLQKEFPHVDGSLIAALYGDSESMAATREVLMELGDGK